VLHNVAFPFSPALDAGLTPIVNVDDVFGQVPVPGTVYVYVPGGVLPGMKKPSMVFVEGAGPVQTPPAAGVPVNRVIMLNPCDGLHTNMELEPPAFGGAANVTTTCELSMVHGAAPTTLYV